MSDVLTIQKYFLFFLSYIRLHEVAGYLQTMPAQVFATLLTLSMNILLVVADWKRFYADFSIYL